MISIENVSKSFSNKNVLQNISLKIESGEITALIGKNGSGKTTLMRLISGLLKPDSGNISCNDTIGVMLGADAFLYDNLTGFENIRYFADLHNMSHDEFIKQHEKLSEILNFKSFEGERVSSYSRGMKQKILFAISVIHNPDTILLDEPSTGLDLLTAFDVINFVKFCKSENKTIFISTHNIFEIINLSDKILILNKGKISQPKSTKELFQNTTEKEKITILENLIGE